MEYSYDYRVEADLEYWYAKQPALDELPGPEKGIWPSGRITSVQLHRSVDPLDYPPFRAEVRVTFLGTVTPQRIREFWEGVEATNPQHVRFEVLKDVAAYGAGMPDD